MYYFAYGSNMSLARLLKRVPSAVPLGCHILKEHDLRFHKWCADGSGKCDAYFTANTDHAIHGALFEIDPNQKAALDRAEGLGDGYDEKEVTVIAGDQSSIRAMTYVATNIVENLQPYSWYLNHVLIGASETSLPIGYIQRKIQIVQAFEDSDKERDTQQREIHSKE